MEAEFTETADAFQLILNFEHNKNYFFIVKIITKKNIALFFKIIRIR
jgi:hypothetical protein